MFVCLFGKLSEAETIYEIVQQTVDMAKDIESEPQVADEWKKAYDIVTSPK